MGEPLGPSVRLELNAHFTTAVAGTYSRNALWTMSTRVDAGATRESCWPAMIQSLLVATLIRRRAGNGRVSPAIVRISLGNRLGNRRKRRQQIPLTGHLGDVRTAYNEAEGASKPKPLRLQLALPET